MKRFDEASVEARCGVESVRKERVWAGDVVCVRVRIVVSKRMLCRRILLSAVAIAMTSGEGDGARAVIAAGRAGKTWRIFGVRILSSRSRLSVLARRILLR